ncbi:cytosolic phospholipase A2 zeta-like [Clarias gariepinus]|uniref:cytosolic phospholipase A2 zeta-like n=1 Tax=Clarias gariepinus TaxID=13013 RepID=UPI00234D024D|nr:cytosolic phospholipase A2 zeta-like [Clarias gariepinus]
MKKELAPHWNLTVTVLRGHFEHTYDYLSQPDLYVTLHLPTASACTLRTRTINNCKTPEWNETFHFRVYSQAKNVLELNLYDNDLVLDDKGASILFDISTLNLGQKETKEFITDDKLKDKLWVEFEMTESPEALGQYLSNGVLLAAPLSTLEVKLDKLPADVRQNMLLKLKGAYNEDQMISLSKNSSLMQTLRYYINKNLETNIELRMEQDHESTKAVPVTPFKPIHEFALPLPGAEKMVNLHLNTVDSPEENMKVRLDFDIPAEEKAFLVKRREVVSRALQTFLNLKTPLDPTKVPTVAVVCSGGSSRAMTATYGSLKGLQSLGLLDAITYITTVSGSTWAAAGLYSDPFWSKEGLDKAIASAQKELSKSKASLFSPTQLYYYRSELQNREKEGHPVTFIDTWGLIIEHLIFGKKNTSTLSDQKKAVCEGQNPLPIYTAVNMKKDTNGCLVPEWCEFTPFEVGFSKYGAFVPTKNFGSEFYLGHVVKKLPEMRISFLLGMWSSFFSANLMQLWTAFNGVIPSWASRLGDKVDKLETGNKSPTLDTLRISPEASVLSSFLNGCPIVSSVYNFLRGFSLHNLYSESPGFNTTNDTHPDTYPNKLTPADSTLGLVDSGFATNTAFPPVLRPHRRADVILCLEFSWVEDHLTTLKETQQYCNDHKLPFPKIDFSKYKSEPNREVYVFEDEDNPDAPIVIHFSLVNSSFKEYKTPGIKRTGKKELNEGNIDVSSSSSPYATTNITFASEDFQRLVDLTSYNIVNNREIIRNALKKALNKKGLVNMPIAESTERTNYCILA